MQQQPRQGEPRSPEFSQQEAENLVREAVANYVEEQSKENKATLHNAVWKLGDFNPPQEEWVGWSVSPIHAGPDAGPPEMARAALGRHHVR
jgi:hypothetical protein